MVNVEIYLLHILAVPHSDFICLTITIREVHNQAVPNGKYWKLPTAALPASGSRVSSQLRLVATGDNGSAPL